MQWLLAIIRYVLTIPARRSLHSRYRFTITGIQVDPPTVAPGHDVTIAATFRNDSGRLASIYPAIKVRSPFSGRVLFDSDRDLTPPLRHELRRKDIPGGADDGVAVTWTVPPGADPGVVHVRLEIWTPAKLLAPTNWRHPAFMHVASAWDGFGGTGAIEILPESPIPAAHPLKVFISYAWGDERHVSWVHQLRDELLRHHIEVLLDISTLEYGDELKKYMRAIEECDVVLPICSAAYLAKATVVGSGVRAEIELSEAELRRSPDKFIPIVRNNPTKGRPPFLAGLWYADMDDPAWRGVKLVGLVRAIRKRPRGPSA